MTNAILSVERPASWPTIARFAGVSSHTSVRQCYQRKDTATQIRVVLAVLELFGEHRYQALDEMIESLRKEREKQLIAEI